MSLIFKWVRPVLSALILGWERMFPGRAKRLRAPAELAQLQPELQRLVLYQFPACPFCVKVRRQLRMMDLPVRIQNALPGTDAARELQAGGGELQVPCLRISDGAGASAQWLYESDAIIEYMTARFGDA